MTAKRNPEDERVSVLISGIPRELLRWFDMTAYRESGGKRGASKLGSGRSGMVVRAMELYRAEKKRRERERRAAAAEE